ncbi:MAG TPA: YjgN family protein [Steroidobacteraceae bacterium]|nr:YjgN family protein [Steroidobacteraceae bacterium]
MNESIALDGAAGLSAAEPRSSARVNLPFEFRGNGAEYFRIWIVNLLLTIVTLGIYSAWAKVRRLRYFYGNTILDGQSFEYHGRPIAILKGRLIVFFVYVIFVAAAQFAPLLSLVIIPLAIFGVPWIIMRSRIFQMRMSSYRNLRFDFHGTYGGAMAAFVGWYLLVVITFGIMFPSWVRKRVEYSLDNAAYGTQQFSFLTGAGRYYAFCYITFGMSIAAYLLFIFAFIGMGIGNGDTFDPNGTSPMEMFWAMPMLWLVILVGAVVGLAIWGYYQASFVNASFGGVQIGSNYVRSNLQIAPLVWIYVTNLLGIVFTLGLFYPWAKVRQVRYQLENTSIDSDGDLSRFTAHAAQGANVLGEEAGDFFDVDFGL